MPCLVLKHHHLLSSVSLPLAYLDISTHSSIVRPSICPSYHASFHASICYLNIHRPTHSFFIHPSTYPPKRDVCNRQASSQRLVYLQSFDMTWVVHSVIFFKHRWLTSSQLSFVRVIVALA